MRYAIGKPGRRFASVAGDLKFASAACPATGAKKGRARKMGRTTRSCIARLPTIRRQALYKVQTTERLGTKRLAQTRAEIAGETVAERR